MHGSVPGCSPALPFKGPCCCSPVLPGHKDCTNPAGTTRDLASTPTSCNYTDSSLCEFLTIAMTAQVSRMWTQMFSVGSMCFYPTQVYVRPHTWKRNYQFYINLEIISRHNKFNSLQPPPEKFCCIWSKELLARTENPIHCWYLSVSTLSGSLGTSPSAVSTGKVGWTVPSYSKVKLSLGFTVEFCSVLSSQLRVAPVAGDCMQPPPAAVW